MFEARAERRGTESEMLMTRAEDMLWPGNERRVPWRDIADRGVYQSPLALAAAEGAGATAEDRRRPRAMAVHRGWIHREGPFPPPKTSVSIAERITTRRPARRPSRSWRETRRSNGRVHYAAGPDVSKDSPVIPDTIFPTTGTVLWFLAVDPRRQAQAGDPRRWSNRLTLTHDPKTLPGGKRS